MQTPEGLPDDAACTQVAGFGVTPEGRILRPGAEYWVKSGNGNQVWTRDRDSDLVLRCGPGVVVPARETGTNIGGPGACG